VVGLQLCGNVPDQYFHTHTCSLDDILHSCDVLLWHHELTEKPYAVPFSPSVDAMRAFAKIFKNFELFL